MSPQGTCRFCGGWKTEKSAMVRYGPRHNAHLRCLAERGRLQDVLRKMHAWSRNQLPALELIDLGVLDLVRELNRAEEDKENAQALQAYRKTAKTLEEATHGNTK